jgi:oxygen-independent coproporphyrinogen-3 oxidase
LLKASDLQILCETVRRNFGETVGEWTVEMAPSTVKPDKLKALKEQGVTRISMGVQSFDDALLDKLGRQHSRKQILKAYSLIREEGFESVNLDLIFAIPGQSEARLKEDIRQAAQLGPDHLSTYCLTFEEDTALFVQLSEGKVALDVDLETRLYLTCWEEMERLGFEQYEVSNFARPGKQCLHNINTWKMDQWIGLGPSAASQIRGRRYSNVPDLDRWLEGVKGNRPNRVDQSVLTEGLLLEDALIFGLRMNEGVDLKALQQRFGQELTRSQSKTIEALESDGKLRKNEDRIWLTREGRLLSDAIGSELMV